MLSTGPGRREVLRSLREAKEAVHEILGQELPRDERGGLSYAAAVGLMHREAARAGGELNAQWMPMGRGAALHWRMAFLVRRWRERRARKWELNKLGQHEYPVSPHLQRLFDAAGCLGSAPTVRLVGVEDMDGAVGWETHLDRAWIEWKRRGKRKGWKVALRKLRSDRAEVLYDKVEKGECAGYGERWRTKEVVDAWRLPSGGVMALVKWPNPLHADEEVRLIGLSVDERAVAHRIIFARQYAKRTARDAVKAVLARAAEACRRRRRLTRLRWCAGAAAGSWRRLRWYGTRRRGGWRPEWSGRRCGRRWRTLGWWQRHRGPRQGRTGICDVETPHGRQAVVRRQVAAA
jgi:hypothetical protein